MTLCHTGDDQLTPPPYTAGVLSSIYPGFHASRTFADVLVGTGYALVDGGAAGLVFGWLYNWIAPRAA